MSNDRFSSNEMNQIEKPIGPIGTSLSDDLSYTAVVDSVRFSGPKYVISIDDAIEQLGMGKFQNLLLVSAGLCFVADSMEVLLLSFLELVVQVEWGLSDEETSSITSSVFAGALLGTLFLGPLADILGRKPIFIITAAIIAAFGLLTSIVTSFEFLILCRFFVGFGVGGLIVPFDTYAEFMPNSYRGRQLLIIEYFWTLGTILVPLLAYLTIGQRNRDASDVDEGEESSSYGDGEQTGGSFFNNLIPQEVSYAFTSWRFFVLLCSIPCIVSSILAYYVVPESPRWLLAKGKDERALSILRKAAAMNGKDPNILFPEGITISHRENRVKNLNGLADLISPRWIRLTIVLWGNWLCFAFLYSGAIIIDSLIFYSDQTSNGRNGSYDTDSFDFFAIMVSASAEIVGLTAVILIIDKFGRIMSQIVSYLFGGLMLLALCYFASAFKEDFRYKYLQNKNNVEVDYDEIDSYYVLEGSQRVALMIFSFLARMFMMSGSCTAWVSTVEVLTTEHRTTGHSAAKAVEMLGRVICPYLATKSTGLLRVGFTFFFISLFGAYFASNIPETTGLPMGQVKIPRFFDSYDDERKKSNKRNANSIRSGVEKTKKLLSLP